MPQYRYKLKNLRTPLECPICHKKKFSPYVDTQTGEIIGDGAFGMCSRASCRAHIKPTFDKPTTISQMVKDTDTRPQFYLEQSVYDKLLQNPLIDNFSTGLRTIFKNADVVLKKYGVISGSQGAKYKDYTGFPYIQQDGQIRSVKMMMYKDDLHRLKDDTGKGVINWLHYFYGYDKNKQKFDACWFGEQLINANDYDYIGVVESEKTCIIATCCTSNILWLACGSIGNKKQIVGKGLANKKVVFFPDANGFDDWNEWVMLQHQSTWKVSKLPQSLTGGDDIADVLIRDASYGETITNEIKMFFGDFVDTNALKYYNSLTKTFTLDDWNDIFERHELPYIAESETIKRETDDGKIKYDEVIKFFKRDDKKVLNFLQVFNGQKLDDFCCEYHFPKYEDLKQEHYSLNFTPQMLNAFLQKFPKTFFNNFTFNVDEMNFTYNDNIFDLYSILSEKTKNIELSSFNKKDKIKLFKKQEQTLKEFCNYFEFAENIDFPNKSLGIYENILTNGAVFCENNGITFDTDSGWQKWFDIFRTIWNIDEKSMMALMLFTIFNMRCRINYDTSNLRLLNIIGDGGVGKDSIITSLIIGCWRSKYANRIWEGSTLGATGFTTETPDKINGYLLQVISDNLKAINESATFDMISNPIMKIENKGQQPIRVRKRFMQVNTNNNARFSFEKLNSQNVDAFARRMLVCKVFSRSKNPNQLSEYKKTFEFFCNEEHHSLFNGWWYWCYRMSENTDAIKKVDNFLYKEMRTNAQQFTYLNNDDDVIISEFERICASAPNDTDFGSSQIIQTTNCNKQCYIVKSFDVLFEALKQRFGKDKIKNTLQNKYGSKMTFSKVVKLSGGGTARAAAIIPVEFIEEDLLRPIEDIEKESTFNDSTEPIYEITNELSSKLIF